MSSLGHGRSFLREERYDCLMMLGHDAAVMEDFLCELNEDQKQPSAAQYGRGRWECDVHGWMFLIKKMEHGYGFKLP